MASWNIPFQKGKKDHIDGGRSLNWLSEKSVFAQWVKLAVNSITILIKINL